jgi:hypothetical protein
MEIVMTVHRLLIRARRSMIVALLFALGLSATWAEEPRPEVGTIDRVQGHAEAIYADQTRSLEDADPIYANDLLATQAGAKLRVQFVDDSKLTLGENTRVLIDRYLYDPDAGKGTAVLRTLEGVFLFAGGLIERAPYADVKIVSPVATLGIRGTTVWGGLIDGQYGVLVLDGVVTIANDAGELTLSAGQGTAIRDQTTVPGAPKRWPAEKIARARAQVEFGD